MGIDGIGGKPGGFPTSGVTGTDGLRGSGKEFKVEGLQVQSAQGATEASALDKLGAGEISMDDYLNQQVELAVQHLEGAVPESQLTTIKEQLRGQLESDPGLSRLVQQATGVVPAQDDR